MSIYFISSGDAKPALGLAKTGLWSVAEAVLVVFSSGNFGFGFIFNWLFVARDVNLLPF